MTVFNEWPASVPYKPVSGTMQIEEVDDASRADLDPSGEPLVRGRSTHVLTHVSFTIIPMTDAENEARKSWIRTPLQNGKRWFRMRLYQSGFIGYECQLIQPMGAVDHNEVTPVLWDVTVALLVRSFDNPRSPAEIWLVTTYGEEIVHGWVASIEQDVNINYPAVFGL